MIDRGADILEQCADRLMGIGQKSFFNFAEANFIQVILKKGYTGWVPFGWSTILVTPTTEEDHSMVIFAPFQNVAVASLCLVIGHVRSFNLGTLRRRMPLDRTWGNIGQPFLDFFRKSSGTEHGFGGQPEGAFAFEGPATAGHPAASRRRCRAARGQEGQGVRAWRSGPAVWRRQRSS